MPDELTGVTSARLLLPLSRPGQPKRKAMTGPGISASHYVDFDREIIFSSRDGYVWASWPESDLSVRLGRHDCVAAMMQNFLAQDAVAERLAERGSGGG